MDFSLARENMVKSQILPNRVTEPELLEVFNSVAREDFVERKHREIAYSDFPVVMGNRRCLVPLQIARLIQSLEIAPGMKVLVVGAGTGYEALLAARLGAQVHALEVDESLATKGRNLTARTGIQWKTSPLAQGWPDAAPFDGIMVCGAIPAIPDALITQLADHGRLTAIRGRTGNVIMDMIRIDGPGGIGRPQVIFQTVANLLPGFPATEDFEL
ncbi:MAG: class I SAM-dependent methyltransferase [Magnetococcales bacterium]|nr:class I SAM-dependent methyltransferase [Magnetococcales bacterium]